MKYRTLGKLDWKPSALGLGCMRLPTVEDNSLSGNIIEDKAIELIRHAIDNGVNYIDTAYFYHSGKSEVIVGKALKDGYREKVKIATKAPMFAINTAEDYDRFFKDQFKKLEVDFIDFYLFHNLNARTWDVVKKEGLIERAEAAQKAGRIGHICFSFHDTYEVFEDIINGYSNWALCLMQYNYMDNNFQAGVKGLKLAASKGIGVAVMEPLKGGRLAKPIAEATELMNKYGYNETPVNLALQWLWNQPEVSVVLSGMTYIKELDENIASAGKSGEGAFSTDAAKLVDEIRALYNGRTGVPCSACSYCMPCPQGINIPQVLDIYNQGIIYHTFEDSKRMYGVFGQQGKNCTACKDCEEKCPQSIKISELMVEIDEKLAL